MLKRAHLLHIHARAQDKVAVAILVRVGIGIGIAVLDLMRVLVLEAPHVRRRRLHLLPLLVLMHFEPQAAVEVKFELRLTTLRSITRQRVLLRI